MKPHVSLTMYVHTSSGLRIFQGTLYLGPADSPLDRSDLMCSSCHDPWSMSSHVMGSAGAAAVSRVQYTVHSTQYTVHSTQYTVHSTQSTVHSTQSTVSTVQTLRRYSVLLGDRIFLFALVPTSSVFPRPVTGDRRPMCYLIAVYFDTFNCSHQESCFRGESGSGLLGRYTMVCTEDAGLGCLIA
jgi:hypothetical protein